MGLPDVSSVVKGIFTKAANPVDLFANKTTSGLISTTAPGYPAQRREGPNPDIPDAEIIPSFLPCATPPVSEHSMPPHPLEAVASTVRHSTKDVPPSAILRLEALAIPSSYPTVQAFCCRTCGAREAKGKPEAYPETLPQNLIEFNSGSTIIPFRILCYSRHRGEREGFSARVRRVLRNWQGDVVAAVQTPPITITNDTPVHDFKSKRALLPTPKARPAVELKVAAKERDVLLEMSQDEMLATLNFQDGAHGADETFFSGKKKTRRSRHKPRPHLYMDYDPLNLLNLLIAGMGSWLNQSILLTNHYLLLSHSIMQALVSSGGLSTSHIPPFTRNLF